MKKISFTQKEKRVIIVLMLVNCFALFVNIFDMSYHITGRSYESYSSGDNEVYETVNHKTYFLTDNGNYKKEFFYPFTFYTESTKKENSTSKYYKKYYTYKVFRGIFPDYDYTEFLVYSLLIFGIPIIRKIW